MVRHFIFTTLIMCFIIATWLPWLPESCLVTLPLSDSVDLLPLLLQYHVMLCLCAAEDSSRLRVSDAVWHREHHHWLAESDAGHHQTAGNTHSLQLWSCVIPVRTRSVIRLAQNRSAVRTADGKCCFIHVELFQEQDHLSEDEDEAASDKEDKDRKRTCESVLMTKLFKNFQNKPVRFFKHVGELWVDTVRLWTKTFIFQAHAGNPKVLFTWM